MPLTQFHGKFRGSSSTSNANSVPVAASFGRTYVSLSLSLPRTHTHIRGCARSRQRGTSKPQVYLKAGARVCIFVSKRNQRLAIFFFATDIFLPWRRRVDRIKKRETIFFPLRAVLDEQLFKGGCVKIRRGVTKKKKKLSTKGEDFFWKKRVDTLEALREKREGRSFGGTMFTQRRSSKVKRWRRPWIFRPKCGTLNWAMNEKSVPTATTLLSSAPDDDDDDAAGPFEFAELGGKIWSSCLLKLLNVPLTTRVSTLMVDFFK